MAFGQLYYTSCQVGLSGSPGFQFQAASPDLDLDLMRAVETATAYQAPRSLTSTATAEQIQAAPVSLCYLPGGHAILAQVVFVGNDYSHRFGNYFAHALVTLQPEQDLAGRLPVELWQAPFWSTREAADQRLDELPAGPPAGPLNRAMVEAFLRDHPGRRHLPALLTAAQDAITEQHRKVVIVEQHPERIACWIAALSYLLPPTTVARMSFTTYDRQPRYSRPDVIGTVPDGDLDRSGDAFEEYFLFDFTADQVSALPVHPAAELLAAVNVTNAPEMWTRAGDLAEGTEWTFSDWAPVIVAAQISWKWGAEQARDLPDLLASWLGRNAGRLHSRWVHELISSTLACLTDGDALTPLAGLMDAADAISSDKLRGRIEERSVRELIWWAEHGDPDGDPIRLSIRTEPGRRQAAAALDEALPRVPALASLTLLDWAHLAGLPLSAETLRRVGSQQLGPVLLQQYGERTGGPVLRSHPELREGVLAYLDSVAFEKTERLATVLSAGLGTELGLDPAGEQTAGIRRATLVSQVRAGDLDPVTALTRTFPDGFVNQQFLQLLWPRACWSSSEATEVLRRLGNDARAAPVPDWLSATVLVSSLPPAEEASHTRLCVELTRYTAVLDELSTSARERVDVLAGLDGWICDLTDQRPGQPFAPALKQFLEGTARLDPDTQRRAASALLPLLSRLSPAQQAKTLDHAPPVFAGYRKLLASRLSGGSPDLAEAARSFVLLRLLNDPSRLNDLLLKTVGRWNQRKLAGIDRVLDSQGEVQALEYFREWSGAVPPGPLKRLTVGGFKVALNLTDLGRRRRGK